MERAFASAHDRLPVIERQAQRLRKGQKVRGRAPKADVPEHVALLAHRKDVADGGGDVLQEVRTRLHVVVLSTDPHAGVLPCAQRQAEIETILALLEELHTQAEERVRPHLQLLCKPLRLALDHLLVFARDLDETQHQAVAQLGSSAMHLLAWAWQRRSILGPTSADLLQDMEPAWRTAAQLLFSAWDQAVRARSAVEHWHRIVRPHLAVHRRLSADLLALLAVWHNYQIASRGLHAGLSPFQRTGSTSSDHHWLAALGSSALAA
ncbi:MAG TPA: hypothetical protein VGF67_20125 [Ktedonobacteraceae bacterium]